MAVALLPPELVAVLGAMQKRVEAELELHRHAPLEEHVADPMQRREGVGGELLLRSARTVMGRGARPSWSPP